jgi:hypothetical protein
VNSIEDFD